MESQPQNPEFRINPENFHPCGLHYSVINVRNRCMFNETILQ